jgi:hypothetical protein
MSVVDRFSGKERSAFLTWASSIDFEKTHQDIFAKKHEKTCDWLIKEPKYLQWSTSPTSSLLWCHGKRKHFVCLLQRRGLLTAFSWHWQICACVSEDKSVYVWEVSALIAV